MKYQYEKGQRFTLKANTRGTGFRNEPEDITIEIVHVSSIEVSYAYIDSNGQRDSGYSKPFKSFDELIFDGRLVPQGSLAPVGGGPAVNPAPAPIKTSAAILAACQEVQKQRGEVRDSADGERSMKRTVDMFNACFSTNLTETMGWQFMVCLKMARSVNGNFHMDDYLDGTSYFALAGESAAKGV